MLPHCKSLTMCLTIDISIPSLVKYHSLCAMQQICHLENDTSLDPPIVFGSTHNYHNQLLSRLDTLIVKFLQRGIDVNLVNNTGRH